MKLGHTIITFPKPLLVQCQPNVELPASIKPLEKNYPLQFCDVCHTVLYNILVNIVSKTNISNPSLSSL